MNKFCVSCGSPISYSANNPPKFCSSCGEPLDGSSRSEEKEVEFSESEARIPKKMKLEYEVSYGEGPKDMHAIMQEQKLGLTGPVPRKQGKGDPLQQAVDECKPARESSDVG